MKRNISWLILVALLLTASGPRAQDTNWVKTNTWYFDNFVKDVLPWSLFRETFIGVAPTPSGDFDQLFYNYLFKDQLAAKGHCYGMDVMAMLMKKNGGHLGYCYPPYMYSGKIFSRTTSDPTPSDDTTGPYDNNLKTAIEMVHGNQINHGFLLYLLDVLAITKSRDGTYAYDQVNYYLAKDDPPVISITKGISPADGGHVIIPYKTRDMGAGKKRIYVYDPNRTFYKAGLDGHDFYSMDSNYIEVSTGSKSWRFNMGSSASPSYWSGDPGGGTGSGNCIVIPLSVAGKRDRLPQSLLAEGAYALNTIFIFGQVDVCQFSDAAGRRYFNASGTGPETDPEKSLNYLMPFQPLNGGAPAKEGSPAVYFFRGGEPVDITYRASGEYRIGMIFHGQYYESKGKGIGETEHFRISDMRPAANTLKPF